MKILFIGDIIGRPGRQAIKKVLQELRKEHGIDLVVANGENIHHGKGITEENVDEMNKVGIDLFTSGNHVFDEKSVWSYLGTNRSLLLRPANYSPEVPGYGWKIVKTDNGDRALVINVLGRVFMKEHLDCPFRTIDAILEKNKKEKLTAILVDFHAEATAEKIGLAHYLDGRVSAVIGSHTHVPTSDCRILPGGSAFQSDVGMVGPLDSVIGYEKEKIVNKFLIQLPMRYEVASGPVIFNATLIEIDTKTRKALAIKQISKLID